MRKLLIIISTILIFTSLLADEENIKKKPLKAVALSCIFPGGGQLYNGKYLKSGFVFALEGSFISLAIYHHTKAEDYYDKDNYTEYKNYYEKRQSDLFWIGAIIFLSAIDSYVDAHLFDFEEKKKKIHLKFEDNAVALVYNF